MNFSLIVPEVEGGLKGVRLHFTGASIEQMKDYIPVGTIPVFGPTHAVWHDHDSIGHGVWIRGEYILIKPSAEDF